MARRTRRSRWRSPRTSTSACSPRGGPSWRPTAPCGSASPGSSGATSRWRMAWLTRADRLSRDLPRGVLHGVPSSTSTTRSTWTSRATRTLRRPRRARSPTSPSELGEPTLDCFALRLRGMAAVRRGATPRASPTSTRRCCRWWPGGSTRCGRATSTARSIHLCDELGDLARMRDWTESLARGPQPLSPDVHVRRRHPRARAAAASAPRATGTSSRRSSAARSARASSGRTAGSPARATTSSARYAGCAVTPQAPARRTPPRAASASTPQPGAALLRARRGAARGRPRRAAGRARRRRADSAGRGCCCPRSSWHWRPATRRTPRRSRPSWTRRRGSTAPPGCSARADQATGGCCCWPTGARRRPIAAAGAGGRRSTATSATGTRRAVVHERSPAPTRALGEHDARRGRGRHRDGDLPAARRGTRRRPARADGHSRAASPTARSRCWPASPPGRATARSRPALVISEKTVGRHLANIYAKAGVSHPHGRGRLGPRPRPRPAVVPAPHGRAPEDGMICPTRAEPARS